MTASEAHSIPVPDEPETVCESGAGLAIWREAPSLHARKTAALGSFWCEDAGSGARLLAATAAALAAEGFGAVVGPMDGSIWAAHRLVTAGDGRPPFMLEPSNPPHYAEAFDRAGLQRIARYCSAEASVATRPRRLGGAAGLRVRPADRSRGEEELRAIHALSMRAFKDSLLFSEATPEPFVAGYLSVIDVLDPTLVLLAEDEAGALQGFLFGLPDFSEGPNPKTAILKTYASLGRGAGALLASAFYEAVAAGGYERVIHALMEDTNLSARHSATVGARIFRRYALWGKVF